MKNIMEALVFSEAESRMRDLLFKVESVLKTEAENLDDRRFDDWFKMLHPSLVYEVPVRMTLENWDQDGISSRAFYMREDIISIETRIDRLRSRFAWAESPATRTRRMVGNIRVASESKAALSVRSNLAVFCYKGEASRPLIVTADRKDEWTWTDEGLKLLRRTAILDSSVLGLEALSIFL